MTLEQAQRDRGFQEAYQEAYQEVFQEAFRKAFQEGFREGEAKKQSEIAGNMIRAGVDDQDVVNYTGISVESVADLKRRLNEG